MEYGNKNVHEELLIISHDLNGRSSEINRDSNNG